MYNLSSTFLKVETEDRGREQLIWITDTRGTKTEISSRDLQKIISAFGLKGDYLLMSTVRPGSTPDSTAILIRSILP